MVTLATNLPGPVAVARLRQLGAGVVKVEPPEGDPLARSCFAWYRVLAAGQQVVRLNLKQADGRARLEEILQDSDLLITSFRPAALERLSLSWPALHKRLPSLCQVALVGHPAPRENRPGHDLTYLAALGLISPPDLPRTLLADLASAERVVSAALGLLLVRERSGKGGYAQVAIAEAAKVFAEPLRYGIAAPGGVLGGGFAGYNLYRAKTGWIAVAALEPHFWQQLKKDLKLKGGEQKKLAAVFLTRSAKQWERWAEQCDLPLVALRRPALRLGAGAGSKWSANSST